MHNVRNNIEGCPTENLCMSDIIMSDVSKKTFQIHCGGFSLTNNKITVQISYSFFCSSAKTCSDILRTRRICLSFLTG